MKLQTILSTILIAVLVALALPAAAAASVFPEVIPLPVGWQAEGIAIGRGHIFYAGSLATGAVYRGDLRTGEGDVLVPPQGHPSVGLKVDVRSNYLFVAGGPSGTASVFDAETGATLAEYQLTTDPGFINDVVVTRDAAYFTNSMAAEIYRVPLGPGGSLPDPSDVETIPLSGDFVLEPGFNANGIEATPNGEWLIIVQSNTGKLFRVDPETGVAVEIDLGGATVTMGDGILLHGKILYVVRNRANEIVAIRLNADFTEGEVVDVLTSPYFAVPTTIARFGSALYAVNARFGTPNPETLPYEVVRVPLH
jgi:sugar lactone lactonase YvrE